MFFLINFGRFCDVSEELGVGYSRERRRSSSSRGGASMGHYEQREDLMVGGKPTAETSGPGLSRTLSLSQDKKPSRSK
jgi:hypothetical protein